MQNKHKYIPDEQLELNDRHGTNPYLMQPYKNFIMKRLILISIFILITINLANAQQFVSDNYLTMPYGTSNVVFTYGARSAAVLPSMGLFHNWEFFLGASLIYKDEDREAEDHFSVLAFAKWMVFENNKMTGGVAFTFGTGGNPAYHVKDKQIESFRNYYIVGELTLPLFNNIISWDLNPGVQLDFNRNTEMDKAAWGFSYASRMAIYKVIPKTAIVGEIYGALGEASANLEYKFGLRLELSSIVVPAITYGNSTDGSRGPGFEIGIMVFSPPFLYKKKPSAG